MSASMQVRWFAVALTAIALVVGCASESQAPVRLGPDAIGVDGSITVSAASSLGPAFQAILVGFDQKNPASRVQLNLASSTALALQIEQGAPADVIASADPAVTDKLAAAGKLRGVPQTFARNRMTIVTKPGNPLGIRALGDLRRADVVAACVATAPCGAYAAQVLAHADVTLAESSITREPDAANTVGAVTNGDADAAIVYVTDAVAAKSRLTQVPIPKAGNVVATYPIAVLAGTGHRRLATEFVHYVQSAAGQAILRRYGFLPPR